jgi:hypothetical protein
MIIITAPERLLQKPVQLQLEACQMCLILAIKELWELHQSRSRLNKTLNAAKVDKSDLLTNLRTDLRLLPSLQAELDWLASLQTERASSMIVRAESISCEQMLRWNINFLTGLPTEFADLETSLRAENNLLPTLSTEFAASETNLSSLQVALNLLKSEMQAKLTWFENNSSVPIQGLLLEYKERTQRLSNRVTLLREEQRKLLNKQTYLQGGSTFLDKTT